MNVINKRIKLIPLKEQGLVSITITVILMLVISITVLSFAQIIRREQRQALDNQLSSQAFYAAESGINEVRKYIQTNFLANGIIPPAKTTCTNTGSYTSLRSTLDTEANAGYTCILVTGSPKTLKYDLSTTASSKVFPVDTGTTIIDKLNIEWTPSTRTNPLLNCVRADDSSLNTLPAATNPTLGLVWPCTGYGIIRIDLVPATLLQRDAFMQRTFTAFLTPTTTGSATVTYNGKALNINNGTANQGTRPFALCTADHCAMSITGMQVAMGATKYFVRVSTIYRDTTFSIAAKDFFGNDLAMTGAQVLLDSTGKAQDVLRRIQVRLPLVSDGLHSDYSLESTDSLCKQFTSFPAMNGNLGYPNTSPC